MDEAGQSSTAYPTNRVRERYRAAQLALGTYVTLPVPQAIDVLADVGFDFIRLDPFRHPWSNAVLAGMIAAARAARLTPWARVTNDPAAIANLLALGVQIITVPEIDTPAQARDVVAAVRHPPRGRRPFPESGGSKSEYRTWAETEILVGCQIETEQGMANYREIIAVDGVDIVHTGRTDISHALGVPGQQFHPRVLDVERRIVDAALEAGKQPALLYPLTEQGIELACDFARRGVRIFALDMDYRVLQRAFSDATRALRAADGPNSTDNSSTAKPKAIQ